MTQTKTIATADAETTIHANGPIGSVCKYCINSFIKK